MSDPEGSFRNTQILEDFMVGMIETLARDPTGSALVKTEPPEPEPPIFKSGGKQPVDSASSGADLKSGDFQYERQDWTMFRSIDTLSQKAGVPRDRLRRLVLKELV